MANFLAQDLPKICAHIEKLEKLNFFKNTKGEILVDNIKDLVKLAYDEYCQKRDSDPAEIPLLSKKQINRIEKFLLMFPMKEDDKRITLC